MYLKYLPLLYETALPGSLIRELRPVPEMDPSFLDFRIRILISRLGPLEENRNLRHM
jgi:hypothetical protein